MTRHTYLALIALTSFLSSNAIADDSEAPSPWSGNIDINALFTSGNSTQTSFGVAGKVQYEGQNIRHTISAFTDFNESSGVRDRERYGAGYTLAYDLSDRTFFSFDGSYESNKFGAFRERIAFAAGAGFRVKDTEGLKWTLEAAPSMVFTREVENVDYVSDFSAFGRSSLEWSISDTTKFTNTSSAYIGGRSIIEIKSAVEFKIIESITSKLSYDVLYDKDAPIDRETTDTVARVGLSYGF